MVLSFTVKKIKKIMIDKIVKNECIICLLIIIEKLKYYFSQ